MGSHLGDFIYVGGLRCPVVGPAINLVYIWGGLPFEKTIRFERLNHILEFTMTSVTVCRFIIRGLISTDALWRIVGYLTPVARPYFIYRAGRQVRPCVQRGRSDLYRYVEVYHSGKAVIGPLRWSQLSGL